ncbi:Ribonuclease 1 [Spatholobus suberectus]|nr:Ribonuclease 1 [Spatholobus suberectus]
MDYGQRITLILGHPTASHRRKLIKPLRAQLTQVWPNLIGNEFGFWDAEWKKHGTCLEYKFMQYEHFNLALHVKGSSDLVAAAKIVPHQSTSYNKNSIVNAIQRSTHYFPQLSCYCENRVLGNKTV